MSDRFYSMVRAMGCPVFWASSRPTVVGVEHTRREGAFILAATHESAYDIPILMRHTARPLDFVSIVEVFKNPFVAWFYGSMNAFPLDRSRRDPATVRIILNRLNAGRVIGMFPEGRFSRGENSVIHTRKIRPGVGRIAQMANVPVVPCVIRNSLIYSKPGSWLPIGRTHYGVAFGEAIEPGADAGAVETQLIEAYVALNEKLLRFDGASLRSYPSGT